MDCNVTKSEKENPSRSIRTTISTKEQKELTAKVYEADLFDNILGDFLHPGGPKLTARAVEVAQIAPASLVLDIASGRGATAFFLSRQYGCQIVGIDLSLKSVSLAQDKAGELKGIEFIAGDVESLPFRDSMFDVVMSECSFSLMQNKQIAASEIWRVLRPGGRLVITDVFLRSSISQELKTQAIFASCIAGAETIEGYIKLFCDAGFLNPYVEDHSMELKKVGYQIFVTYGSLGAFSAKLDKELGAQCATKGICSTPSIVWQELFKQGKPGYALIAVAKPGNL